MALKDDILNDFFNDGKNPELKKSFLHGNSTKSTTLEASKTPINLKQQYKNYKVFDKPEEILRQNTDKLNTNIGQIQDITNAKIKTNIRQKNESRDKHKTESKTIYKTITEQIQDKTKINTGFISIVGLQRDIVIFLYELCKLSRDKITNPLSIEHLAISCKTTKASAQKTIQRLENKGIIKRAAFKIGRGGWTRYEIPENTYQEILYFENYNKLSLNLEQTWDKSKSEIKTEFRTLPSSSSFNSKTTTNDSENLIPHDFYLNKIWLEIDIEPLNSIGFTQTHLIQITSQNKLQPQAVQDSIYAFAFDLQENNKAKTIKGDLINFFMGILRNGRVYTFPSNYESPQDKAMRLYTEQKEAIAQKKKALEKKSLDLAFGEWFGELTEAQKIAFLPENMRNTKIAFGKNKIIESAARSYFETEIWPDKRQEILQASGSFGQELQQQISTNIEQEVPNVEDN